MKWIHSSLMLSLCWLCCPLGAGLAAEPADPEAGEFTPVIEAEMPIGFPERTPVGEIQVKSYPKYRRATANGTTAFGKLFYHIQANSIAMTAPVEMTYGPGDSDGQREKAMSFLYGRPDLGHPGKQGLVEVNDVPAMTVVSIGVRGRMQPEAVQKARGRLEGWLAEHKDAYRSDGPMRVMGHNSPFVPADRQYFEVQIPVRQVPPS